MVEVKPKSVTCSLQRAQVSEMCFTIAGSSSTTHTWSVCTFVLMEVPRATVQQFKGSYIYMCLLCDF